MFYYIIFDPNIITKVQNLAICTVCSFRSGTKNNYGDFAWQCNIGSLTASQVTIQHMMVSNIFRIIQKMFIPLNIVRSISCFIQNHMKNKFLDTHSSWEPPGTMVPAVGWSNQTDSTLKRKVNTFCRAMFYLDLQILLNIPNNEH